MARKNKKKSAGTSGDERRRTVVRNRKASHDYELLETLDCGLVLLGSEVKSIRNNKIAIDEAYARLKFGELWLIGADIAEYPQANYMNHERRRDRKLLCRKAQIRKIAATAEHQGLTMIPLAVYFERGFVKMRIAVARGRKKWDKRQKLQKKIDTREMRAARRR